MSDKPKWSEAPEWAQWLAQDESGDWYWYEKKPQANSLINEFRLETGRSAHAGNPVKEWRKTLEKRPAPTPRDIAVRIASKYLIDSVGADDDIVDDIEQAIISYVKEKHGQQEHSAHAGR